MPVHRVMGMLQEIWTGFVDEVIGILKVILHGLVFLLAAALCHYQN